MPEEKHTLADVASRAAVSLSTASKALNDRPGVSEAARQRVLAAADELGYAPTIGLQAARRHSQVQVVFKTFVDPYSVQVLDGIIAASHEQGVKVLVDSLDSTDGDHGALTDGWIRGLGATDAVGVILVALELSTKQLTMLRANGLPAVHIDPMSPPDDHIVSVGATNFVGGVQATQHLIELGHRRIGFAGGSPQSVPARERMHGYLAAMATADLQTDPALVLQERFTVESGISMGTRFFAMPDAPTAVFAASDQTAMGVFEAARRHGKRIPEDVSVIGFDDTYLSPVLAPPLTTIRQPVADMGRVALRSLLQLTRGERPDSRNMQLATELVIRASTAPPSLG